MAHHENPVIGDPGTSRSKHPALEFLGASGTVTGSRFLVTYGSDRLLVDAGLYQGLRELRRLNWAPFPVAPADLAWTAQPAQLGSSESPDSTGDPGEQCRRGRLPPTRSDWRPDEADALSKEL